jgi:hypothetical protein
LCQPLLGKLPKSIDARKRWQNRFREGPSARATSEGIGQLLEDVPVKLEDQAAVSAGVLMKGVVMLTLVPHEEEPTRKQLGPMFAAHAKGAGADNRNGRPSELFGLRWVASAGGATILANTH